MTCHSRAKQMFIDAQYQPHSSSVRVRTLAAMSPTTPTHLALPPHNTGRGNYFQVTDGGCWAVAMCFHTIRREGSCVFIYLLLFFSFSLSCFGHIATPLPPLQSHCPFSFPICDVEAAIFLWWLPQLSPWRVTLMTNWVWKWRWWAVKAMPLPPLHTLCTYTRKQPDTKISVVCVCLCVCACTQSCTQYCSALSPALRQRTQVMLQAGWRPGCISHKERKQEMEILTSFNSNFDSNICFPTASSIPSAALLNKLQYCSLKHAPMWSYHFSTLKKKYILKADFSSTFEIYSS